MAASGKTVNYDFGIYNPNDTCSYLQTFNQNMTDIDRVCKETETVANEAKTVAGNSHEAIDALQQSVISLQNTLTNVNNSLKNVQDMFTFVSYSNIIPQSAIGGDIAKWMITGNGRNLMSSSFYLSELTSTFKLPVNLNGAASSIVLIGGVQSNCYMLEEGNIIGRGDNNYPNNISRLNNFTITIGTSYGEGNDSATTFRTKVCKFFAVWDGTTTWIFLESTIKGAGFRSKAYYGSRTTLNTYSIIDM